MLAEWTSEILSLSLSLARNMDSCMAILDAAFQRGVLPEHVKSSLVTPVFKKGDKCQLSADCSGRASLPVVCCHPQPPHCQLG